MLCKMFERLKRAAWQRVGSPAACTQSRKAACTRLPAVFLFVVVTSSFIIHLSALGANYPTAPMPYQVLGTTNTIAVKMGEGTTTTAPTFAIAYVDVQETATTPAPSFGSFTTSYAVALAAPSAGTRLISSITLCNIDTVTHTFYVNIAPSGTPSTITAGLVNAYSLAAGASASLTTAGTVSSTSLPSPLTVPLGGTGTNTLTNHGVVLGQGTSAVVVTSAGTAGQPLQSGGASADPSFAALNLATAASITGALPAGNMASSGVHSGDATGTFPTVNVVKINGVALGSTTATAGNILIADGANWVTRTLSNDASVSSTGVWTNNGLTSGANAAGHFQITGPTAARTYTVVDANATLARTDAAQTFTGLQTFTNGIQNTAGWQRVTTQADRTTTTLSATNLPSWTLTAGRTYTFQMYFFITADAAGGVKMDMNGGAATAATATAYICDSQLFNYGAGTISTDLRPTTLAGSHAATSATGTSVRVIMNGTITVNVGGNFAPQFAQNNATGTSSILVGSWGWVHDTP